MQKERRQEREEPVFLLFRFEIRTRKRLVRWDQFRQQGIDITGQRLYSGRLRLVRGHKGAQQVEYRCVGIGEVRRKAISL